MSGWISVEALELDIVDSEQFARLYVRESPRPGPLRVPDVETPEPDHSAAGVGASGNAPDSLAPL